MPTIYKNLFFLSSISLTFACIAETKATLKTSVNVSPTLEAVNAQKQMTAQERLQQAKAIVNEHPTQASKLAQQAYEQSRDLGDISLQVRCLHFLAKLSLKQKDFYLVQMYLSKAEPLLDDLKDTRFKFSVLMLIADIHAYFKNYDESLIFLDQAIALAESEDKNTNTEREQWLFDAYYDKAQLLKSIKQHEQALENYLIAESHSETLDNATRLRSMDKIAAIYKYLHRHDERIAVLVKAIVFMKKNQNEADLPQFLVNLSQAQRQKNNYAEAINNAHKALTIATRQNNTLFSAKASVALSRNFRRLGDYSEALKYSLMSVSLNKEMNDLNGYASALNATGLIYQNLNDNEKGIEYFRQVLALPANKIKPRYIAAALREMGRHYYDIGKYEKGLSISKQAFELYAKIKDTKGQASVRKAIGLLYQNLNEPDKALTAFDAAISDSEKIGDRWSITANLVLKSKLLMLTDLPKARAIALEALSLSEKVGSKALIVTTYNTLILIETRDNNQNQVDNYTKLRMNAETEINISRLKKQQENSLELKKVQLEH